MTERRRIGLFGGTFDPIHLGHLAAAQEAADRLALDVVEFIPAHQQPLKERAPRVSDDERLAMVRAATADNPCFRVSTIELERPAPSYTMETLRLLRETYGADTELFFLLGVDAANTLDRWLGAAEILRLVRLVVMSRAEVRAPDWAMLETLDPRARDHVETLLVPAIDVSSSDLRDRVAAGRSIRYQVPEAVRVLIEEQSLYKG